MTTPRLVEFVQRIAQRFHDDRCMRIASSLTFTTLLSLVPIITVAVTLISAFPVFSAFTATLKAFVLQNILPQSANAIAHYAERFTANAARLTAVGLGFLVVAAILLLMTIDRAFNEIWRVRHPRPLLQRVVVYWTLLTIGPVLVGASLTLTSWLVARSVQLVDAIPGAEAAVLTLVPIVLTSLALALLYMAMPNRRIALGDALTGGVIAGLAFEAMKRGFAFYIARFPTYKLVYGAFATIPIFLMWIYLSWLIVLLGAVVVAVLPEWRERAGCAEPAPGSGFLDALRILRMLQEGHRQGRVVRLADLFGVVKVRIDRIEAILEAMMQARWISRAVPRGWVLSRDLRTIRVAEVFQLFALSPGAGAQAGSAGSDLEASVRELAAGITGQLQMSVEELFERMQLAGSVAADAAEADRHAPVQQSGTAPRA